MTSSDRPQGISIYRKSPLLAFLLGLILGPIGAFYFGWRTFLLLFIGGLLSELVAGLIGWFFHLFLPPWVHWLWPLFFAFAALFMCASWNEVVDESDGMLPRNQRWEVAATFGLVVAAWEFRVLIGVALGYTIIMTFVDGRVLAGIIALILLPMGVSFATQLIVGLLSLIVALFSAGTSRDS